jgi:ATP-dependent RNA helicase RhlE
LTFDKFDLDKRLMKGIAAMGYERPTPIQDATIPLALKGRDLIGSAQTGTGKTAAFGLPILQRLLEGRRGTFRALILSPTRELAVQIDQSLKSYAKHTKLQVLAIYGGVSYGPQEERLKQGVDVIVATPGRLLDHIQRGRIKFKTLETLVLDEADRMLDMGFLPDINRILSYLPSERQTMMFSATMPSEIQALAGKMLLNPEHVQVGLRSSAAVGITHAVYPVSAHLKADLLLAILRETQSPSVLVFTRTKRRADRVEKLLAKSGKKIAVIHGDRTQKQRTAALDGFKQGKYQVLVATDIAARGLDVEAITHVINFDVPGTPEDYVHRIGRTARMAALGDAFTLVSPEEEMLMREVEQHLGHALPRVALRDFKYDTPAPERSIGLQKASVNTPTVKKSFFSPKRPKLPRKK